MLRTSLIFALAASGLAQTHAPGFNGMPASEREIMSGSGHTKSGLTIAFRSVLTPAGASWSGLGEGGIWVDAETMHRYMIDRKDNLYFGYDLAIGEKDASGARLVTFKPLTETSRIDPSEIPAGMKLMELPKYPPAEAIRGEETLALDLMVSADGKQRLTDYIKILSSPPPAARTAADLRDFTIDDGPVIFDTTQWTFWEQGQQYQGAYGFTGKPGATLWVAIPGKGRYVLSLAPHEGFTKSGAVRGNVVTFGDSGRQYEIRFQSPVAGAGKAWNLYVKHDLSYVANQGTSMIQIGVDRLENLVAGR